MASTGPPTDQTPPPMVSLRGFNRDFPFFFLTSNPDKSVFEHWGGRQTIRGGTPVRTGGSGAQGFPTHSGPSPFTEPVKRPEKDRGPPGLSFFFSVPELRIFSLGIADTPLNIPASAISGETIFFFCTKTYYSSQSKKKKPQPLGLVLPAGKPWT